MRIAQVAPLFESVPPRLYGGTERVVHYLTEELVRLGHEVTLFASGDSRTSARLVPCWPRSLRLSDCRDMITPHVLQLEQVIVRLGRGGAGGGRLAGLGKPEFDIVHFHTDFMHCPITRRLGVPVVTTLHGRLDLPELPPLLATFPDQPLISISDAQREPVSWANWAGTVYHGLPPTLLPFRPGPGRYLAFTGRIAPEKRPDLAIEIARRAGLELRIAAKVDRVDRDYFERVVRPLLDQPGIVFLGEIGESEKAEFFGNAIALLFPIDWPEPFGLVMIESMSCGTPVIAMRRGSVPEVVDHGQSGLIVDSVDEAVAAVAAAMQMDRRVCRAVFEARFTARRMAEDHVRVYRRLCHAEPARAEPGRAEPARAEPGRTELRTVAGPIPRTSPGPQSAVVASPPPGTLSPDPRS